MKSLKSIFLFCLVVYAGVSSATRHSIIPISYWNVKNYCTTPVNITILDENGNMEISKTLQGGEDYTVPVSHVRNWGIVEHQSSINVHATDFENSASANFDYIMGMSCHNGVGVAHVSIPRFYYNPDMYGVPCKLIDDHLPY